MEELKKIYNKIFIFISLIIFFIICLFLSNKFIINKINSNNYIFDGDIDYSVYLNNNQISNQKLFVTSTVNNIKTNFNYKYSLSNKEKINYHYDITGYVISNLDDSSKEETEVYNNKHVFTTKSDSIYSNEISINENLNIDYNIYNKEATDYDNSINIPIKSRLLVKLNLYVEINNDEECFTSYISIPLEDSTFSILKVKGNKEGSITANSNNKVKILITVIIILLIIFSLVGIVYYVIKLVKYRNNHIIEFKYRKIINDYNNVVVPINSIPKGENIMCARVQYFKSMIDIQKELHVPILCYRDNERIIYLIYSSELVYVYFLNNSKEKI